MTRDPLAGSPWSAPGTVAGFVTSPPNEVLLRYATGRRAPGTRPVAIDVGCGAGRNSVPLAESGWEVFGTDLSWPMLQAAMDRARTGHLSERIHLALAAMDRLPVRNGSADLVIAHGIWNLAQSTAEFRRGVREAARIARHGAGLFVFTFSRHTLPDTVTPVEGEAFVYTEFSGQPQCFLTDAQLIEEVGAAGFVPDPAVPLTEYNRPRPGLVSTRAPVIYEAAFVKIS